MMVMPLGPDFSAALDIPTAHLGFIGGSYTAAAAVSGLASSLFLDRFGRRRALFVAMLGLVLGTALGGVATGLGSLLAARVVAGLFGGPATSLSLAIIADVIPPERRGKAMGAVMGSFSAASGLGVPAGLELARLGGGRAPFFSVAALGLAFAFAAVRLLPPLRGHRDARPPASTARQGPTLWTGPASVLSFASGALGMMSSFLLIPNISAFIQGNLAYPREHLGLLYLCGGAVSFFVMRLAGRLVDRFGVFPSILGGCALLGANTWLWFVEANPAVPVLALFVTFMIAMALRNVSYNALVSRVPRPEERARFMSSLSAVQHLAAAAGSFLSAQLLVEGPGGSLQHMDRVAWISLAMTLVMPFTMRPVERLVRRAEAARRLAFTPSCPAPASDP